MKRECTKCGEVKPLEMFSLQKKIKSGRRSACKECKKKYYAEHYAANSEKLLKQCLKYRKENSEKRAEYNAKYRLDNREKRSEYNAEWAKKNPDKRAAKEAKRRAAKLQRTMPWLTDEQHEEIDAIYSDAAMLTKKTGIEHQVDHIIPMQGKNISGLHVPWNLQVLTASENISKKNRWEFSEVDYGNA